MSAGFSHCNRARDLNDGGRDLLMSTTLPRLSITINVGEDTNVRGKLNSLAIGFGIHQAWIYLVIFGIAVGGPLLAEHGEHAASQTPSAFIVSIVLPVIMVSLNLEYIVMPRFSPSTS